MSLRILHIDEQRGWRGGEQQAAYLMQGLVQRGHDCILACRSGAIMAEPGRIAEGVHVIPMAFRNEMDVFTARGLAKVIREQEVDVVHAHTSHAHTMACMARKFAGRGKVVVSRRVDFAPKTDIVNRMKYRCPDQYVAISGKIAEVLRDSGIDDEKISLVYSAIDPERLNVEPIPRGELISDSEVPLIGNVAALVDHKDQQTLIRAMAEVVREIPNARLVIAGEGECRPRLEALILETGLGGNITLLGYRNDVPAILGALDVFVMSSKQEGLGTSILDAMAARIPVAATSGGGIPEVVQHEKTGLLANVGDSKALANAMIRLNTDQELAANLVKNADAFVRDRHSIDAMVEGNVDVYRRLMEG